MTPSGTQGTGFAGSHLKPARGDKHTRVHVQSEVPHIHEEVLYRETGFRTLLYVQAVLIFISEEYVGDVARRVLAPIFFVHADDPRVYACFDHVRLYHGTCLF